MAKQLNKLDAAQRQLDCAIRLVFAGEDNLPIYTITHACFTVLRNLHSHKFPDKKLLSNITKDQWKTISSLPNYLKHADNDPEEIIELIDSNTDISIDLNISTCIFIFENFETKLSPEIKSFHVWLLITHPDLFMINPLMLEIKNESFREFLKGIKSYTNETPEERRGYALRILDAYRNHPELLQVLIQPVPDRRITPKNI